MRVAQFTRKPGIGHFSIEGSFEAIRAILGRNVQLEYCECPKLSQGIVARIQNVLYAWTHQADVNHILGDVHYLALGLKKRTTILTICDCGFAYHPNRLKRFVLLWFWLTLPARKVARICAISEKTKREILSLVKIPEELIAVIPVCISDKFQYHPAPFKRDRPVILQIGTAKNKNVIRLIRALRGLGCVLHLIGELHADIRTALHENEIVYKHGQSLPPDGIVRAYQEADIVAFVSNYEGFGLPVVEANATGRVVVTSRIEPLVSVAGGAAILVDPDSVGSIRDGIVQAINDDVLRGRLIAQGLENAKKYRIQVVAAEYLRIYREIWDAVGGASREGA
jgi:glycosyltransferase involved in cell wall biosynthesis